MAGFEGPREPGAGDPGSSKLPSWAVTRPPDADEAPAPAPAPAPDAPAIGAFADVGPAGESSRAASRVEPPVARVPEHPFDIDDPFGDKQLGGTSSPWIRPPADDSEIRVVDLADEFHLTTAQALEVCAASGTPAASGAAWLTVEQADAFRAAVVTYDRSEPSAEEYPSWAVPPGGRRPHRAPLPASDAPVPGAALLARTTAPPDDDADVGGGGRMRVVLLIAALITIAVLVALLLLG